MPKFTDRFDSVYERHAPGVPVLYLRALAAFESNSNPASQPAHDHWGLLQVGKGPLADYNKQHGTNHSLVDVLQPALNVKIFANYYAMVGRVFDKLASELDIWGANLVRNWGNKEYALFVTAAWNSGIGAVKKAVQLAAKGRSVVAPVLPHFTAPILMRPITAVDMFDVGRARGSRVVKKVLSVRKQAWQARVVGAYIGLVKETKQLTPGRPSTRGIGGAAWILLLLLLLGSKK